MKTYPIIQEVPDLFLPISTENIEKIKHFLDIDATLANQYNLYDGSALHAAIWKHNIEIVSLLIERGANIYTLDYNHDNCIEYARKHAELNNHILEAQKVYQLLLSIDEKNQLEKKVISNVGSNKKNKL
jgi:ankyrin repeat protein